MLKNLSKLEVVIEDKVYQFICDHDAQIHHVKDALSQFIAYAVQFEEAVKKHMEDAKAAQQNAPVNPPVNTPEEPPKE